MPTEAAAFQVIQRALWDPTPTDTSDRRARQLAVALGYPLGWRVIRSVVDNTISDRIFAGKPNSHCDSWFHHEAATEAAAQWDEETDATPCFKYNGGHLLPRTALYSKGQKVQVHYQDEWWDAKILKSRKQNGNYVYQVHYSADRSKQNGVDESFIRLPQLEGGDSSYPSVLAVQQGLGEDWQAFQNGTRWKMVSPGGTVYHSKKAALNAFKGSQNDNDADTDDLNAHDPPWRTQGHAYCGRKVFHSTLYKVSSRRSVPLEQVGTIVGWLDITDVDRAGNPAHVNEQGEPCMVFLLRFQKEPAHPYSAQLLTSTTLELPQVEANLVEEGPPKKKSKT